LKYLKQFIIPIAGLEAGIRQYEYSVDGSFFKQYADQEIVDCNVRVELRLVKQEDLLILDFSFSGSIGLTCDRCLDPFQLEITGPESVVLKFRKKGQPAKEDDDSIAADAVELDLRQYIFDFIMLRIPFRRVHPEDENGNSQCDQEVIKKLEALSKKKDMDSPWDPLKDLQNN
jgi:uncharacterized metal-binding protein YceD (DUF177 family)